MMYNNLPKQQILIFSAAGELGGNWETGYEDWQPAAEAFKGLDICFVLHSLSAYHPYSIPDILRMRKFGLMINIRHKMPTISL